MTDEDEESRRLTNETIILTGASRGLGASMAIRFVREGATVILAARGEAALEQVAADAGGEGEGKPVVVPTDVTDQAAVEQMVDRAVEETGTVTGLVNNAGIGMLSLADQRSQLHTVDPATFRQIIEVNVTGAFLCAKYAVAKMLDGERGNVVNVSSGLGRRGAPGFGPYVASKWALEGMTQTQAMELDDAGINVNAIDPGGRVDTGFWDHLPADERERIMDPDVMNHAATLLLAQGPDGISGESHEAAAWERLLG